MIIDIDIFFSCIFLRIKIGLVDTMWTVQFMLMLHWSASKICLIQMTSEPGPLTLLFYFSIITVSSEIFSPYLFILGIERPGFDLFMSMTEAVTSQREVLIPRYWDGLDAVTKLLSKAAPLTDLYLYLRDHPLQNLAKAKVHCEYGFGALRFAVKAYLDVSFLLIIPP